MSAHHVVAIVPAANLDASEAFYRRIGFTVESDYGNYRILADGKGWHLHLNHVPGWPRNIEENPLGLFLYVEAVLAPVSGYLEHFAAASAIGMCESPGVQMSTMSMSWPSACEI